MLFSGGWIFDGTRRIEGHAVLVEGSKIVKLAPQAEFAGYSGEIIDTTGATLLPGLIDCHVHLCFNGASGNPRAELVEQSPGQTTLLALRNARSALQGGVTAMRDCGGKEHLEFAVRDAIKTGAFMGPTICAAGRFICMTGGHGHFVGRIADGCDEVIKSVREEIHAGCDLIKLMATGGVMTPGVNPEDAHFSFEEMLAGVKEAKRFNKKTASHAQGTQGILNAARAGVDSIEHGIFMTDETVAEMLKAGIFLVPTLAAVHNIITNEASVPAYVIEKSQRMAQRHRESIKLYYEAGGRIAMGTDAGTPFNRHGENTLELALMASIGMKPVDILASATRLAAELMGLDDRGEIAEGKAADLLLVAGDPVELIAMVAERTNHRAIYKDGRLVAIQ